MNEATHRRIDMTGFMVILFLLPIFADYAQAQILPDFLRLPIHSVALADGALAPVVNPAGLGVMNGVSAQLLFDHNTHSHMAQEGDKFHGWGYAVGGDLIGFVSENTRDDGFGNRNRHTLGFGLGGNGIYLGCAYSWFKGIDRSNNWDVGMLVRPLQFISFGAVARGVNQPRISDERFNPGHHASSVGYDFGLALRPLGLFSPPGSESAARLTLFADAQLRHYPVTYTGFNLAPEYEWIEISASPSSPIGFSAEEDGYLDNIDYRLGALVELLPGISASITYSPEVSAGPHARDDQYHVGLTLDFGNINIGRTQHHDTGDGVSCLELTELYHPTLLKIPREKFVEIRLDGPIVEYQGSYSWFMPKRTTIYELTRKIEQLGRDPEVAGILLRIGDIDAGFAKLQEIRQALLDFMYSGRSVVVFMEDCGNGEYYLASVADHIFINPVGEVRLTGLTAHSVFLKGTLDKVGVDPNFIQVGRYKSAAETFTREEMSEAQREELDFILDGLYDDFVEDIADGRGYIVDQVRSLIDDGPFRAADAFSAGLVDSLVYEDELEDILKDFYGKRIRLVTEKKYNRRIARHEEWNDLRKKSVAIVFGSGAIVSGESSGQGLFTDELMGSATIARALRSARESDEVAAIVFRIDSPGGSMLASDVIMREVKLCTEDRDRKPIIVSMSDVAGSGGYYIACMADKIIAMPGTITGSIGVISGKMAYERLYGKLGVSTETLTRGKYADMWGGHRSFTDEEWKKVQGSVNQAYNIFLERVAEGRGLDTSEVNAIAQGRIWSGEQAMERGLVDMTGGLDLAIQLAALSAGIREGESFGVKMYPHRIDFDLGGEMLWMVMNRIPDSVRQLARDISGETRWRAGEPLLLMPYTLEME